MQDFRNLKVWEKSHSLTLGLYALTRRFPKQELYGLTSQIRRSAASIPANIAEGCGRGSDSDAARFFQMCMGSACELDYHLLLARDLGFMVPPDYDQCCSELVEIKRMLSGLLAKVRAAHNDG